MMNECVGDGVEEEFEDFEDAGGGNEVSGVGHCCGWCVVRGLLLLRVDCRLIGIEVEVEFGLGL